MTSGLVTPVLGVLCVVDPMPPTHSTPATASTGYRTGRKPTLLIYRVVCTDEEAMHWRQEGLGDLRVALNLLVRVFRM